MGWGPCQSGGALPEVAEVTTSLGPVVSPEGFPASCLGGGEQRGICLAASDLGSWGEAEQGRRGGGRRERPGVASSPADLLPVLFSVQCCSSGLLGSWCRWPFRAFVTRN